MNIAQDSFDLVAAKRVHERRRVGWLIYAVPAALLAVALLGFAVFTILHRASPAPAVQAPSITVTIALPVTSQWTDTLDTAGAIAPWQEASIGSQIGGYQLTDVRVNVGDVVTKGQVLARFDAQGQ